jgi:hypothetical protein
MLIRWETQGFKAWERLYQALKKAWRTDVQTDRWTDNQYLPPDPLGPRKKRFLSQEHLPVFTATEFKLCHTFIEGCRVHHTSAFPGIHWFNCPPTLDPYQSGRPSTVRRQDGLVRVLTDKKWLSVRPYEYVPLARTHKVVLTLTFYIFATVKRHGRACPIYGLLKSPRRANPQTVKGNCQPNGCIKYIEIWILYFTVLNL